MNFEIRDIIDRDKLKIKTLVYTDTPIASLDLSNLSTNDIKRLASFKSDKRKREFFYTRLLWRNFEAFQPISYNSSGKPELPKGHLSISHSSNTIAISYCEKETIGIDIEHYNPKIEKIKDKFLSKKELSCFDYTDQKTITTLWSIKEAVYKLLDIEGLSFKKNIQIIEIGEFNRAAVHFEETHLELDFHRITFDTFILTFCTKTSIL